MNRNIPPARTLVLALLALASVSLHSVGAKGFDDAKSQHIEHPDWFEASPFNDLEEVLNGARSDGKKGLMVLFTTEGCSYCERFIRKSLGDPKLAARVQANFDTVGLEIFDDRDMTAPEGESMPVKQFAQRERAEFAPTLLFYGDGGDRLIRQVGYQSPERFSQILDYLLDGHVDSESLRDYLRRLAQQDATTSSGVALNNDPLIMKPPYALDRSRFPAEQPLLVIFEKADCGACNDFHHDVLQREDIRALLKGFDIARFDAGDTKTPLVTPDGKRTTPAEWFAETSFSRLPALMFFEENGRDVLHTDALVAHSRMLNSVNFVLQRAYQKGWTYQRFARTSAIEKQNQKRQ